MMEVDWHGDNTFTPGFDPNVIAQNRQMTVGEAFAGIETHFGRAFTRISIEFQNWECPGIPGVGNIDFTGYGFDLGYSF